MEKYSLFKQTPHPKDVNDFYHTYNLSNVLNVLYWDSFFKKIHSVDGDIVECGVGRGRSLITILSLNLFYSELRTEKPRSVYALDSFEGFPDPSPEDHSPRNPKKGEWSASPNNQFHYSPDNLLKILDCADLGSRVLGSATIGAGTNQLESKGKGACKLKIVKGFFDSTTPKLDVSQIALLHLDGDLYASLKSPLENLAQKVSLNGIIVIDDFQLHKEDAVEEAFPGARTAISEFLNENKNFEIKESIRGTPYLCRVT